MTDSIEYPPRKKRLVQIGAAVLALALWWAFFRVVIGLISYTVSLGWWG